MDAATWRAWNQQRQGLDGALTGAAPAEVLARTGWARSVGGCNGYLQMFARAGVRRAEADAALRDRDIHELPSARGCTYVLPASDFAVGLRVGERAAQAGVAVCAKLGVPRTELDALADAVLAILGEEPLSPRELTAELGGAVRSLGEAGRKKGASTPLPTVLGLLQAAGEIRRVPVDGRLDQQRYGYARWSPSPLAGAAPTEAEAHRALALRYWAWTGGASLAQFRWFSAFTVAQAKAATAELDLRPLHDDLLALPEDAEAFAEFTAPTEPAYALLGWLDGLVLLRRDLPVLLEDADAARRLPDALSGKELGSLADLPAQAIVDRGRVVGLWEYDPAEQRIAYASFVPVDDALTEAVARTEEFVRDELGDARGSSLDSPKGRAPRLAALRGL